MYPVGRRALAHYVTVVGFRHAARVLVPFGLIPEKAAKGFWAEALRLVLAPTTLTAAGDVAAAADQQAESDNAKDDDAEEAEAEKEEEEEEEEREGEEMAKGDGAADAGPADGRRGDAAVVEGGQLTLPGGRWDEVRRACGC